MMLNYQRPDPQKLDYKIFDHKAALAQKDSLSKPINKGLIGNLISYKKNNRLISFDDKVTVTGAGFVVESFEEVHREALSFAAIISQSVLDSMPDIIFTAESDQALFRSDVPHASDAYDFMMSDRLDIYAETIGLSPSTVRRIWLKFHKEWVINEGLSVAINVFDHVARLLLINKVSGSVFADAKNFLTVPQMSFWSKISGMHKSEILSYIRDKLDLKTKAYAGLASNEEMLAAIESGLYKKPAVKKRISR